MKPVADWWRSFEEYVIPPAAGAVQRQETARAFYAGFYAALMAGLEIAEAGGTDAEGAARIEALHAECKRFAADVEAGRA